MSVLRCPQCDVALSESERVSGVCSRCEPNRAPAPQSAEVSQEDVARRAVIASAKKLLLGYSVAAWTFLGLFGGAALGIWIHQSTHTGGIGTAPEFLLFVVAPAVLSALLVGLLAYFGGRRYAWVVRSGYWLFLLINLALIALGVARLVYS